MSSLKPTTRTLLNYFKKTSGGRARKDPRRQGSATHHKLYRKMEGRKTKKYTDSILYAAKRRGYSID